MAKIIGVHGIGHQFKGEHTTASEWLPALNDGLARAGHLPLGDKDFECAFYGDLFRPAGKGAMDPLYDASDVADPWEQSLLELWWREAACVDEAVRGPDAGTKTNVSAIVQRALDALSRSRFFAGLAERALIFDLKQVHRYFRESDVRREARSRVQRAIGPDTRVVIGHSLGSVVAYEALCADPKIATRLLVTLGSPLGIRNLIFHSLDPSPGNDIGRWPTGIERWVNIADRDDVVALVKDLHCCFGPRVEDHLVDNGAKAHDVTRYLTTRELGVAVAAEL